MFGKKYINLLMVIFILLVISVTSVTAATDRSGDKTKSNENIESVTYSDTRFDFSVEYPNDWQVIPRDDTNPKALGGLLTFIPSDVISQGVNEEKDNDTHDEVPQIIIGLYLAELETGQSLAQWTEQYEAVSNDFDESLMSRQARKVFKIDEANAIYEEGVSPLTTYQFTNLVHGKTVWFVWTNITSSANDPYSSVYKQIVESFAFGKNAPTQLKQVYGNAFKPIGDKLSNFRNRQVHLLNQG